MFQLGASRAWSTFGEQGKSWDLSQMTPQTRCPWFSQELRCGDVRGKALVPVGVPCRPPWVRRGSMEEVLE